MPLPPNARRAAAAALALLAAAPGCSDSTTPMTVDADRVAAPPGVDAPAPPAARPKRGEIRSPKDDLLKDAP